MLLQQLPQDDAVPYPRVILVGPTQIDPMYQYALPWFSALFCKSIGQAPPAPDLEQRLQNLNDCFTAALYVNVCRSLFEAHKLLFSFLLAIKILQVKKNKDRSVIYRAF